MNPDHPDFEDLSAYHDGEAPQWADHVAACATCRDRVAEIADLGGLVAQIGPQTHRGARSPTGAMPAGIADDPVGRAVAAVTAESGAKKIGAETPSEGHDAPLGGPLAPGIPLDGPAEPRRWWMGASVAAILVFSVALGALVASRGDQVPASTAVGSGAGNRATAEAGRTGDGKAAAVAVGDLGEISDRAALVARVRADLDAARTSAPSQDLAAMPEASPTLATPESSSCETEARRGPGERGAVIYRATAEKDGTPAVVLAFGPARESDPITVEARARSDCRLLLQGAIL